MHLIAHRANLNGPVPELENNPKQIETAIRKGFDVEIDVWVIYDKIYLGHDEPQYKIDLDFLKQSQIWAHAKNLSALEFLLNNGVHCFYHENDKFTLTSRGFIWTYPNQKVGPKSVIVTLDKIIDNIKCYGVCGDYVETWKQENSHMF